MIFQLEAEGEIEGKDLIKEIIASQHTLFGDIGSANGIAIHGGIVVRRYL